MRRATILLLLVLTLTVSACSSGSTTKTTVTVINTMTGNSSSAVSSSSTQSGGSSTAVNSSSTMSGSSSTADASATPRSQVTISSATSPSQSALLSAPSASASPSATQIVKVDPLTADCHTTLDAADVKKAVGFSIVAGVLRRKDIANPSRGVIGKIRCYYPTADAKGQAPVVLALTQYATAATAAKQITATVDSETQAGAVASTPEVNGFPAKVLLRSGGLILLQYDTWTITIAVADKLANANTLTTGLPKLAQQVLTRLIKGG